jgi:spore germination protein GerM
MRTLSRRRALSLLIGPLGALAGLAGCGAATRSSGVTSTATASSSTASAGVASRAMTATARPTGTSHQITTAQTAAPTTSASATPSVSTAVATTVTGQATQRATAAPTGTGRVVTTTMPVVAYFTIGSRLVAETRQVPPTDPLQASLAALLAGPQDAGHYTQVPPGTHLRSVHLAAGNATITLSRQATAIQGSPAIPLFLAQVVETATQFPTVRQVTLQVEGRLVTALGGEGLAVPEPLDRPAVHRLLAGTSSG